MGAGCAADVAGGVVMKVDAGGQRFVYHAEGVGFGCTLAKLTSTETKGADLYTGAAKGAIIHNGSSIIIRLIW